MAKDKVITVMCAARLPEMLVERMDAAAASGGVSRAQFIAQACRKYLECPGSTPGHVARMESSLERVAEGSSAGQKPTMADLRAICAGTALVPVHRTDDPTPKMIELPECRECGSPMRSVKGKWACADQSCPLYGKEQKV